MKRLVLGIALAFVALFLTEGCASSSFSHRRALAQVGDGVERVAKAIKKYQEECGHLPPVLKDLVPQYLSPDDLVVQHGPLPFLQAGLVYLPHDQITDPDHAGIAMLVFTSTEVQGGGRFVIDGSFKTWFVGESRFQDWIMGRKVVE